MAFSLVPRTEGLASEPTGSAKADRSGIRRAENEFAKSRAGYAVGVWRSFTLLSILLAAIVPGVATAQGESRTGATRARPNILFALADDWGWPHAGAYGDEAVATPTFDRLAREGVLFTHAFVSSPSCTPSRNAILTGQPFFRLGEGANLHSTLDVSYPTFMRRLAAAGYEIGHWRKAWGPGRHAAGGYDAHPCGPRSTFEAFLERRDPTKPFCFWFGTSDPHRGYVRHSGRDGGIDLARVDVPGFLPDHDDVRGDIADYLWEVQRWDREVGQALARLERCGVLDETLIVMTGDHGMPFPRCKGNLYDHGTRVPLAMRWGAGRGQDVDALVSLTDLAPTFLAAAGVAIPDAMTGRSLVPFVRDGRGGQFERESVVLGRERHTPAQAIPSMHGYPSRALRSERWLLILNLEPGQMAGWRSERRDASDGFVLRLRRWSDQALARARAR